MSDIWQSIIVKQTFCPSFLSSALLPEDNDNWQQWNVKAKTLTKCFLCLNKNILSKVNHVNKFFNATEKRKLVRRFWFSCLITDSVPGAAGGEQRERGGGAGGQAEAGPVHCGGPSLMAPAQVQHRVQDPQGADQIQGEENNIFRPDSTSRFGYVRQSLMVMNDWGTLYI